MWHLSVAINPCVCWLCSVSVFVFLKFYWPSLFLFVSILLFVLQRWPCQAKSPSSRTLVPAASCWHGCQPNCPLVHGAHAQSPIALRWESPPVVTGCQWQRGWLPQVSWSTSSTQTRTTCSGCLLSWMGWRVNPLPVLTCHTGWVGVTPSLSGGGDIGITVSVCLSVHPSLILSMCSILSRQYPLNRSTIFKQTWYCGVSSWDGMPCRKLGSLPSRLRSQWGLI